MATKKQNVAAVNNGSNSTVERDENSLEFIFEALEKVDSNAHAEKQGLLSLFIEKAANVLANEKTVARLNTCYGKLCKLNDKKLARAFINAFTVLSSDWTRQGKKIVSVLDTNCVKFTTDGKLKLMQCSDVDKFIEHWNYHRQAIKFNQTTALAYVSGVAIEKATQENTLDATKKAIVALYKKGNVESKKLLADFMREKGIDIPTF